MRIFWGRCYEDEGTPPYWPWVQAIRSYVQQASAEQLISEIGRGAAVIADVVPEIHDKITDLKASPALQPEAARFRLFNSISTFLKNVSQSQPLMLVLDDLHWADQSSLRLLEFLARELGDSRFLLVGCYRDTELSRQHTLADTLARLSREPVFSRQVLRGLGQDELGQLIEATTGVQLSQELTGTLYAHTEDNPFFMTEVIRLLSESGKLTAEHIGTPEGVRVPASVREVIGQRLNRLSDLCNQVLTTASIIGREFEFKLLSNLIEDITEDRVLEAVEEALASRIIEEPSGTIDRYQFSHALIQETLAQEISTTRRVRLHARIADALEGLYGDEAEAHAAELAHHYNEAQASTGYTKLVRYSLLAGDQALASHAWGEAITHFERGLVARSIALSGTETASDAEGAALLFGLARAQNATAERHQLSDVVVILSRAFEYYAEAANVSQAVAVAAFPITGVAWLIPGRYELIARALTLVPADSHEAGLLLSLYGGILGSSADYEGAQQALDKALSIARREKDVPLEVETLGLVSGLNFQHLHWQESVDDGLRAIELADGDEYTFSDRFRVVDTLLRMGDLDAARPHAVEYMRRRTEERGTSRRSVSLGLTPITYLSSLEGDWRAAREYSERGLELLPTNTQLLFPRMMLEYETGESAQGEVYLERLLDTTGRTGPDRVFGLVRVAMGIPAVTRITGISGRLDLAKEMDEAVISNQSVPPVYAMQAKVDLALLAVQQADQSAAAEHYSYHLGQRGTMIPNVSSIDRLLGLLSRTMCNLDQSVSHFEDALAFCRKAGYRPELAWACCDYSDGLFERNDMEDHAKSMALLDESLAISADLGMRPLTKRVNERLELLRSQPNAAPAYPGGLTEREVEVLRLLASGKTNSEIAEELIIAEATSRRHVANIYEKIGASNRAEATRYAIREGILPAEDNLISPA